MTALPPGVVIRDAVPGDEGLVDHFVRQLAIYEKMEHLANGTPQMFAQALFSSSPRVWALIIEHAGTPDVAIVDPPRAGLSAKVVRRVMEAAPKRIVYVSCNPTTLAPNMKQMVESGYELRRVRPVDMFPHTPHIETVAVLDLVDDEKRLAVIAARIEERRTKGKSRPTPPRAEA